MSPGNSDLFWDQKVKGSRSQVANIAGVGLCTPVGAGFFSSLLYVELCV